MEHFQRPPLAPLVKEEISQSMHLIDQKYWPLILEFRIAKRYPLTVPFPPLRPLQLLQIFRSYASELFKVEADRFEPFRAERLYGTWLSNLSTRISVHLQKVFKQLDDSDPDSLLMSVHGITNLRMDAAAQEAMNDLRKQYLQEPRAQTEPSGAAAATPQEPFGLQPGNRERIDRFILKMAASDLKIKRKDIWRVAGYNDRTEFERFQRGDEHNKAASLNFNRILNLEVEDFRKQLMKLNR